MSKSKFALFLICTLLFLTTALAVAQDSDEVEVLQRASFVAYSCLFDKDSNSVQIQSVVMASNGQTLPRETYQIEAMIADTGEVLPADSMTIQSISQRPPLQMIIVLDTTDTVPITQVVTALTDELMPRLLSEDQVALLTFSAEVAPRTQFYTDKNRLVNEHMLDLLTLEGDNQLYDAVYDATSDFPLDANKRQVVLLLTDSSRRQTAQTPIATIVEQAQRSGIQIYSIAFFTRDRPDLNELRTLANETGGYVWLYDEIVNSRATIEAAVRDYLEDFTTTLNNEVLLTISMQGQQPDPSGNIALNLTMRSSNEETITESVVCPLEVLTHNITFNEDVEDATVLESIDVGVNVESDLNPDALRVVFRVNDEVAQESASQVFTFDAANNKPGYYTVGAQLVDANGEVLATTPSTLEFYVRQTLELTVAENVNLSQLSGEVDFEAVSRPEFELRAARFDIAPVGDELVFVPLDNTLAAFDSTGRAVLTVPNIKETIRAKFPNAGEDTLYRVRAVVPGATSDAPDLASSNEVEIGVAPDSAPVVVAPPVVVPEAVRSLRPNNQTIPNMAMVGLALFNVLLYRAIRRAGVRRMIRVPDRHDLSAQLMSVTVRRDGVKSSHTLTKKTVTIGRGSSNDINLGDDPNISRQHGVIMWRRQAWYYANRKPRAIAKIDGRRFVGFKRYKLEPITEIEIGNSLLIFHSNAQQDVTEYIKTNL